MKRKARKRLKKQLRALRTQAPDVVIGLVTGIVTNLITDRLASRREQSSQLRS